MNLERAAGDQLVDHRVGLTLNHAGVRDHLVGRTDALLLLLRGEDLARIWRQPNFGVVRVVNRDHAARSVNLTGDAPQVVNSLGGGDALEVHVEREAPLDCGGLLGHLLGSLDDVFLVEPGHFSGPVEIVGLDGLIVLVKAIAPQFDEFLVVELFLDDVLAHGESEHRVGAGAQLQPQVGASGQPGQARVNDDELRATLHAVDDPVAQIAVSVRDQRVVAPDEDVLRGDPLGVVVTIGELHREVGAGVAAHDGVGSSDARNVASIAGMEIRILNGAESIAQACVDRRGHAAGAGREDDRLAAELVTDLRELLIDDVVGLFPRDAGPLIRFAAIFGVALHRVEQTIGMVDGLGNVEAAHAETTLVVRVLLVAFDLDELAGLLVGVDDDAAAVVATRRRPCGGTGADHPVLFPLPRQVAARVHDGRLVEERGTYFLR